MASGSDLKPGDPLLVDSEGHEECLLGNEAIVRGALEAGVAFACGYPGTPSSEVTDSFARLSRKLDIQFEYSVNEKVALEMAFGASLAGARAICSMKHLGLMYAGDPLSTIPYVGTVGGMVIVSAADPSCLTSPNEQDQRRLGPMLHIPFLDPSTPQEALELSRFAFELSEKCSLPVVLRPTTRLCHSRGIVRYGNLTPPRVKGFQRDRERFNPIPAHARRMRKLLKGRIRKAEEVISGAGLVSRRGTGEVGILAAGVPAATCSDILEEEGLQEEVVLISLGAVWPLPEEPILAALRGIRKLLVLEELSPHIEDSLTALAFRRGIPLEILGKQTGHLPEEFEYTPEVIRKGLQDALGFQTPRGEVPSPPAPAEVPPRPPILCAGCPHTATYSAAREAFDDDQLFFNDIGCYTLGYGEPLEASDALLCMGAGFTLAASVARLTGKRTVGFLGDSTFFHSGMPALLNAIKEGVNMVAVVLDNDVTAMTGFQESPTVSIEGGQPVRRVSVEGIARALGAEHVERIDPFQQEEAILAFQRAKDRKGVSVIVSEQPCPVYLKRETGEPGGSPVYEIDQASCTSCWTCVEKLGCPAFYTQEGMLEIDPRLCEGCGICSHFCPTEAIEEKTEE